MVARLSKCEITLCIGNTYVLEPVSFDRILKILKLTDIDLHAYGSIKRGSLRMNYAFQAKVKDNPDFSGTASM